MRCSGEEDSIFYLGSLDGPKGQLDWRDKVFLFEGYRCRHNFDPGRIQCLSSQDIYFSTGTYSLMLSAWLVFPWQRAHSLGDRDSMKASITGPLALHFPITRPVLRSQKLTFPVEY